MSLNIAMEEKKGDIAISAGINIAMEAGINIAMAPGINIDIGMVDRTTFFNIHCNVIKIHCNVINIHCNVMAYFFYIPQARMSERTCACRSATSAGDVIGHRKLLDDSHLDKKLRLHSRLEVSKTKLLGEQGKRVAVMCVCVY